MMRKAILICLIFCLGAYMSRADEGMWMINGIDKALEKKMKQRSMW